jgi:diguanylate cyclase (GGDEF)-like protein/putative nucleotidyltransferase with HDIG domain
MISFPLTSFNMPEILESDGQPINNTVGALPYWDICIGASQTVRELLDMLDKNVQNPGVLVLEQKKLVGLIPREKVYEKLGRPFGVELFLKNNNKQFYEMLRISTLVLSSDTLIDEAVEKALMRDEQTLYEPIVVAHLKGHRVISMYNLLMAQQATLRNLYSEVRYLSTKDALTLVNNRRGFFETVNQQMVTIRHFDLEYAVLMIDIDNFKNVNDRYGHLVGDDVIKSVAQRIFSQIREKDVLGRFGGEEFVVFSMDISKESAFNLAEKIRQDIASLFHTINGFQIRVTISIGISHSKGTSTTFDELLTEADQAVYAAKDIGRNKVMMWAEKLSQPPKERRIVRTSKSEPGNPPEQILNQTLRGLLRLLYLRDYETEAHTLRVSEMALSLAKKVGVPADRHEGIRIGALLHDIGKIAIPDKILFKQGKLTEAEWAIMQKHPQHAHDLISPISYFQHALDIPYCHHEHWNGKGYPRGLREAEIPLAARIFTIVDVWDALSSDRPYRAAWKEAAVKEFLVKQAGIMFDPALVPPFLESLNMFPAQNR